MVLRHVSTVIFTGSLIIGSLYMALNLSALSILLLILLETTKTTLAAPRLQNIWVLCAITAVFTAILLTINLLVLHGNRELRFFISYTVLFAWSITICVGYTVAGYKMWRNSKSSRQLGDSTGKGRLATIITKVFVLTFTTTVVSILKLFLAASDYSKVPDNITEITKEYVWSWYIITFVNRSCELVLMILIFEIVIRAKTRRNSVNEAQVVQLGTFSEDTKNNYQIGSTGWRRTVCCIRTRSHGFPFGTRRANSTATNIHRRYKRLGPTGWRRRMCCSWTTSQGCGTRRTNGVATNVHRRVTKKNVLHTNYVSRGWVHDEQIMQWRTFTEDTNEMNIT